MIEPTAAEVEARAPHLALPGDSWDQARARARRLLKAVVACEPCRKTGCADWIEQVHPFSHCRTCSERDAWYYNMGDGREHLDL